MPIFFPLPPPFIGGHQPAEPRRLTPPSAPDAPPLMRTTIAALAIIALSWQAIAPIQAQPPRAPRLVQDGAAFVADNPPPLNRRRAAPIYLGWKWRPVGSGDALAPPPVIDDPPFGAAKSRLRPVYVAAWDPPQIILLWQAVLAQEALPDQPSVRSLAPVLAAWHRPPPLPVRPRRLVQPGVAPSVNDPPFDLRTALWPIVRAWQSTPRTPQMAASVPLASVVLDNPPFGMRPWRWTVHARWQPGPPAPPLARDVVVTESGIPPVPTTLTQLFASPLTFVHASAGPITAVRGGAGTITTAHAGAGLITTAHAGAGAVTFTHAGAGPITREA